MSTQFYSATTDEWVCTRWGKGPVGCYGVDWGVNGQERAMAWMAAADAGEAFFVEFPGSDYPGRTPDYTGADFAAMAQAANATWTFGEFGGTFEVGRGDAATFGGM